MRCFYLFLVLLLSIALVHCTEKREDEEISPPPLPEEPITFNPSKEAVLLDLTFRSLDAQDAERNRYSARHMFDIAGVPYFETQVLSEAMKGSLILFSSPVKDGVFTTAEIDSLQNWVNAGGVIVSPACLNPAMNVFFGISGYTYKKDRHLMSWSEKELPELVYFDHPFEKTISFGKEKYTQLIKTYGYTPDQGEVLASFNSGEAAVIKRLSQNGRTYLFGLEWRDVIQRPQMNKDFDAQRVYSNGFEPASDVFPLFLRAVWADMQEASVWKYTIPKGYQTVLIPTHDIDSKTGYDEMHYMSDYEKGLGLNAHYFMTTHYFRDNLMSAFYNETAIEQAKAVLAAGHTIGSHSVGHFQDFSSDVLFPMGDRTLTKETYHPFYNTTTGMTENGFTYAELSVSKNLLESDVKTKVRSFRSGHLCANSSMTEAMEGCGYQFSSAFSAGDLLTGFPFFERRMYKWEGELSSVLQIPMAISDVFSSDPITKENYLQKVEIWKQELEALTNNYAPCVILVHPNREWKKKALRSFIEQLNRVECGLYNFETFGDFWLNRFDFDFSFDYNAEASTVTIRALRAHIVKNSSLGLVVESKKPIKAYRLIDEDLVKHPISVVSLSDTRKLVVIE